MANLLIEVPPELEQQLREEADRRSLPLSEYVRPALESLVASEADAGARSDATPPIWEVIAESVSDLPEDVLASLPTDLAEQHDHYIYGTPKRQP